MRRASILLQNAALAPLLGDGSSGSPPHDAALLRAARADAAAFEAFYTRWAPPLHAWLRARLNDPESANDLTAETFAAALVGLGRFRGEDPGDGVAWLWGIARNLLHQHYRTSRLETSARRRLGVTPRSYDVDVWDDVDARTSAVALARELADAMRGLTPGQRRAIELRIVADLDSAWSPSTSAATNPPRACGSRAPWRCFDPDCKECGSDAGPGAQPRGDPSPTFVPPRSAWPSPGGAAGASRAPRAWRRRWRACWRPRRSAPRRSWAGPRRSR